MGFWIFILLMNMMVPLLMIGFGWTFLHNPPKTINMGYGYRTSMSMKNQDTWDFAHQYAGGLWLKWGKWLLVITVLLMMPLLGKSEDVIGNFGGALCMLEIVPLIFAVVVTEKALKKTFDSNGNRRETR